jgi:prepilin-type processing-associated H-X9-DG protein
MELLVVIAIIALLISILLPTLKTAKAITRKLICSSNMRQIGIATQAYLFENGKHLPPSSCRITDPDEYWLRILSGYTGENLLFQCPSDTADNFVEWDKPLINQPEKRYSSFAVNALLDPVCFFYSVNDNRYNRVDNIRRPQYTIWIAEAPNTEEFLLADHLHPESWQGSVQYAKTFIAHDRHRDRANYLFSDGRVDTLEIEQTYAYPKPCYWFPDSAPMFPSNME